MRLWSVFIKSLREQVRDPLGLSLALVFAPFFVLLYWLFFPSGSTTFSVMVLNQDEGADGAGDQLVEALRGVTYASGDPLLSVRVVDDRAEAETRLRNRDSTVLLVIPPDFSDSLAAAGQADGPADGAPVEFVGDLTNPYYSVAAVLVQATLDEFIASATGQPRPIRVTEDALGASGARSEFEVYVPGLLVFAVMMLVFTASMTVTREAEAGTLRRLQITRMTAFDLLGGVSGALVLVGIVSVVLTFLAALALGFRSQGPLWVAVLVGALTTFSVIGAGLVVASLSKTVTQAFLIANFPLGLFMFFSSAVFPVPRVRLFSVAGRTIGLYDVLPPTHAVVALNKVLTLGAGLGDVLYELAALAVLSALYFAAGVWLFQRTHMRAA